MNTGKEMKTRGGSRGTRGVGTRRGGRNQGLDQGEPEVSTIVSSGFIEEDGSARALEYGTPLETPKHDKRRRSYTSSPLLTPQREDSPVPSTLQEALLELQTSSSVSPGSSVAPEAEERVPSPAVYETGGGSSQSTLAWEDAFEMPLNYGSEDDSGDSDEEEGVQPTFIPRVERIFFDGEDEDVSPSVSASEAASTSVASSPPPVKPYDLFDFDWRPLSDPPVSPTERREVFSENNCGPTAPFLTPYDAFIAIWDQEIMEYIAAETNRYAQEVVEQQLQGGTLGPPSRLTRWRDTDANELYVYFALLLVTGMRAKSDVKEYWNEDHLFSTPNLAQHMSFNRFILISKCLHFAPNSPHVSSLSRHQAKLYKIDPIIQHLNSKFQSLYRLHRNITVDESLTQWKGRLSISQYISSKAASVGIKTYEVCESQTGYLWKFRAYAGLVEETEREVTPVSGVVPTLVLELLKGLEYKGHTVWMDSYFNAPALARVLKSLGFDCVGTLRTNRQCVPRQIKTLTKSKMRIGEVVSCTSGDVDIVVWRDQNRVALLSTYHGAAVHTAHGQTEPIVIHDYNVCMGGVDLKDQILSTYAIESERTRIWYKKIFNLLLNVSVLNARVLHSQSPLPDTHRHIKNHRDFRYNLVLSLLQRHNPRPILPSSSETKMEVGRPTLPKVPILHGDSLKHFPDQYGFIPGSNRLIRRSCVVCHKRVSSYCPECNVPLCIFTCMKTYHSR